MSFYGSTFVYNDLSSDQFGLRIGELDGGGVNDLMGSNSLEIVEQKIYRRSTPFFYGSTAAPKLSFEVSAYSEQDLDGDMLAEIQRAYFSTRVYKQFKIMQSDISDTYFNALLLDPKITKIGNVGKGITFTVSCDSPFAWHYPKITTWSFAGADIDESKTFLNNSDDSGAYLYPSLTITMNTTGGNATITNSDDGNRVFQFTGLSANEVIIMDCSRQTLSSSTGLKRLGLFNKKFLRLVPGINHLRIQGGIARIDMTTQFVAKKI